MDSLSAAPPLRASSTAHATLTNPALLRLVMSFQAGLPFALFDFWLEHDPQAAISTRKAKRNVLATSMDQIVRLVITQGSPRLAELLMRVSYRKQRPSSLVRPAFFKCARLAIESNRVEMVQWALLNIETSSASAYPTRHWWADACRYYCANDFAVLALLDAQRPIDDTEFESHCLSILVDRKDLALLQWMYARKPTAVANRASAFLITAAGHGDLAMVRYVHTHMSSTAIELTAFRYAYDQHQLHVLEYLIEQSPAILEIDYAYWFQRNVVENSSSEIQALAQKYPSAFRLGHLFLVDRAVANGDVKQIETWCQTGWLAKLAPIPVDLMPCYPAGAPLEVIRFLYEKGLATATTEAMDNAAEYEAWDVVDFLHAHFRSGCTTRAMDAAVDKGNLERIQFLYDHYGLSCSADAVNRAVATQPIAVVQLLHTNASGADWTSSTMDAAAAHGRLDVVRFLHTQRTEGCTTAAIDGAAGAGHLGVVRFLLAKRSEGFTRAAISAALTNGHVEMVHALFGHSPNLFDADMLYALLLHGVFDVFMQLRDASLDQATDVMLDKVLFEAGKTMELPTIRFIMDVLGRSDLAYRAVDGAVFGCSLPWLRAVLAVTGPESCRVSAVHNAIAAYKDNEDSKDWEFIPFTIDACNDPEARAWAIDWAKSNDDRAPWLDAVEDSSVLTPLPPMHPLLTDPRTRAWAIEILLDKDDHEDVDASLKTRAPLTWAVRAVDRHDLSLLQVLKELPVATVQTFVENNPVKGMSAFSFEGARESAIRAGDLSILEWLLKNVELPIESTLLGEAVYLHQYDIAEWLVVHYPEACTTVDWTDKGKESELYDCGLQGDLLDWLDGHDAVRKALAFDGMIDFAAQQNDAKSLRRVYAWYPALFEPRSSLMELLGLEGRSN